MFQTITNILSILPALITAIKAIEEAIPGQGKGEQKLVALRELLEEVGGASADILPLIEKAVAILVNLFNTTGVFKK